MPEEDAQTLIATLCAAGWRQGSFISLNLTGQFAQHAPQYLHPWREDNRLVIISHDCDVNNRDLAKEPWVEVLRVLPIDKPDGNIVNGKNSRTLHFSSDSEAGSTWFQAQAFDRFFAPREILALDTPDLQLRLDQKDLSALHTWLSNRFVRPTFPDTFNKRLAQQHKKIEKTFKDPTISRSVSGIYLRIDPSTELLSEQSYLIILVATMRVEDYAEAGLRDKAGQALQRLAVATQACEGIEVEDYQVRSEQDFTLDDVRLSMRFFFDYISLRDEGNNPLPADIHEG